MEFSTLFFMGSLRPFKFWLLDYRKYRTFQIEIVEKNGKSTKTPVFNFTKPFRNWWTDCTFDETGEESVEIASSTSTIVFPRLSTLAEIYVVTIGLLYLFLKFL